MNDASEIAHIVQLAVAPVFLLAGIGAILSVVTARLGRVVDRARCLEGLFLEDPAAATSEHLRTELTVLDRRMVLAQRSIALSCIAALLICCVVVALFLGAVLAFNAATIIAGLFVMAMLALIGGLSLFLMEVTIATRTLRVRAEVFMR